MYLSFVSSSKTTASRFFFLIRTINMSITDNPIAIPVIIIKIFFMLSFIMSCIISLGINREKNIKLNTVIENPTAKNRKSTCLGDSYNFL